MNYDQICELCEVNNYISAFEDVRTLLREQGIEKIDEYIEDAWNNIEANTIYANTAVDFLIHHIKKEITQFIEGDEK